MLISQIAEVVGAKCVQNNFDDCNVKNVYTGDLLSDILGNADDSCVIVTIQAHTNTVAVASTKDSKALIICNDREVTDDFIEAAKDEHIAVFITSKNQFEVSGILYEKLKGE